MKDFSTLFLILLWSQSGLTQFGIYNPQVRPSSSQSCCKSEGDLKAIMMCCAMNRGDKCCDFSTANVTTPGRPLSNQGSFNAPSSGGRAQGYIQSDATTVDFGKGNQVNVQKTRLKRRKRRRKRRRRRRKQRPPKFVAPAQANTANVAPQAMSSQRSFGASSGASSAPKSAPASALMSDSSSGGNSYSSSGFNCDSGYTGADGFDQFMYMHANRAPDGGPGGDGACEPWCGFWICNGGEGGDGGGISVGGYGGNGGHGGCGYYGGNGGAGGDAFFSKGAGNGGNGGCGKYAGAGGDGGNSYYGGPAGNGGNGGTATLKRSGFFACQFLNGITHTHSNTNTNNLNNNITNNTNNTVDFWKKKAQEQIGNQVNNAFNNYSNNSQGFNPSYNGNNSSSNSNPNSNLYTNPSTNNFTNPSTNNNNGSGSSTYRNPFNVQNNKGFFNTRILQFDEEGGRGGDSFFGGDAGNGGGNQDGGDSFFGGNAGNGTGTGSGGNAFFGGSPGEGGDRGTSGSSFPNGPPEGMQQFMNSYFE